MKMHARDRRKWFAANFGKGYFKSQPLINPSGLIGFALPCLAILLVCAVVFGAHAFALHDTSLLFMPLAGLVNINQLKQNKTDWTKQAGDMLEAANAAGGFNDQTRKAYNDLKAKIETNNELLAAAEGQNAGDGARGNEQNNQGADLSERQRQIGIDTERSRVQVISETVKALRLPQAFADQHIKDGTSIEILRKLAIDEAKRVQSAIDAQTEIRGGAIATPVDDPRLRDEIDARRFSMTGALLERFEPQAWSFDERERNFTFHKSRGQRIFEGSRHYIGMSLLDVAKECLANVGIRWQTKSKTEIVRLAFQSTSDFPYILADSANKSLRAGYDMYDSQWRQIAARRTAADFKTMYELTLDQSSRLEQVKESGEFRRGALTEGRESYVLKTYGKIIAITRQAIINDDLGAFTRVPMLLGQEVAMLEADTVIGIITANGNLADAIALFEADTHKNYVATGAAIAVDSIGALRVKMMLQTSPGGKPAGIVPRYLLAPATKGQLAMQYCSPNYQASESAKINPWAGQLTPVVEPRLDAAAGGTTAWYLFADPNTPNGTVLIYAYLEGQEGPYTETRQGFDVDGVEVKIRQDFAAAAVDFRGAAKQVGA